MLDHLVLDFSGTLSVDGKLLPGLAERLGRISRFMRIMVLTADTYGKARGALRGLPLELRMVSAGADKVRFLNTVGPARAVAIGNGRNDVGMVKSAALGIAIGPEGACGVLVGVADLVVKDVRDALDLVMNPLRLKATLRD
jgi:soluble P-type ATPase